MAGSAAKIKGPDLSHEANSLRRSVRGDLSWVDTFRSGKAGLFIGTGNKSKVAASGLAQKKKHRAKKKAK